MSEFTFKLTRDEDHNYRVKVVKGNVPFHSYNGMSFGISDPEALSEFEGCYSPGDALRVFADSVDRAMADAWFEEAGQRHAVPEGEPSVVEDLSASSEGDCG